MTNPFNNLRKKMSPAAQHAATRKTQQMLKEMPFNELRQVHPMGQERMVELLSSKQTNVSRKE